jgi:hypothetical protein
MEFISKNGLSNIQFQREKEKAISDHFKKDIKTDQKYVHISRSRKKPTEKFKDFIILRSIGKDRKGNKKIIAELPKSYYLKREEGISEYKCRYVEGSLREETLFPDLIYDLQLKIIHLKPIIKDVCEGVYLFEDKDSLRIGYSKVILDLFKNYKLSNHNLVLLGFIPFSRELLKKLKTKYKPINCSYLWFSKDSGLKEEFQSHLKYVSLNLNCV